MNWSCYEKITYHKITDFGGLNSKLELMEISEKPVPSLLSL